MGFPSRHTHFCCREALSEEVILRNPLSPPCAILASLPWARSWGQEDAGGGLAGVEWRGVRCSDLWHGRSSFLGGATGPGRGPWLTGVSR